MRNLFKSLFFICSAAQAALTGKVVARQTADDQQTPLSPFFRKEQQAISPTPTPKEPSTPASPSPVTETQTAKFDISHPSNSSKALQLTVGVCVGASVLIAAAITLVCRKMRSRRIHRADETETELTQVTQASITRWIISILGFGRRHTIQRLPTPNRVQQESHRARTHQVFTNPAGELLLGSRIAPISAASTATTLIPNLVTQTSPPSYPGAVYSSTALRGQPHSHSSSDSSLARTI